MLDSPAPRDTASVGGARGLVWPWAFMACAGVLGATGVMVGAAGTHRGGGELTRISSEFLLIHAAAIVAGSAVAPLLVRVSAVWTVALGLLTIGAVLFGGELALAGLLDWRPIPLAAPIGGLCLIFGWLLITLSALLFGFRRR